MSDRVIRHFYESSFCAMVALKTRLEAFTEATLGPMGVKLARNYLSKYFRNER